MCPRQERLSLRSRCSVNIVATLLVHRLLRFDSCRGHGSRAVLCGHELLTIFIRFAMKMLSTLDPTSTVILPANWENNMSPVGTLARTQSSLRSRTKKHLRYRCFFALPIVPPAGIEPTLRDPQSRVLSVELQGQWHHHTRKVGHMHAFTPPSTTNREKESFCANMSGRSPEHEGGEAERGSV